MRNKNGLRCSAPFVGTYIGINGEMAGCALMRAVKITDKNLNDFNYKQLYNHPKLVNLRKDLLEDNPPKKCLQCMDEGDRGICWGTDYYNKYDFNEENFDKNGFCIKPELKALWLTLDNTCSFACAQCLDTVSTRASVDRMKAGVRPITDKIIYRSGGDNLIELVKDNIDYVQRVNFNGGDPTLDPRFIEICKILEQKKDVVHVVIHLNGYTNDNVIEALRPFKNLCLEFSVDSYGKYNDIIRQHSHYEDVMEKFDTLVKEIPHAWVVVHPTVMNLNACNIGELIKDILVNYNHWNAKLLTCRLITPSIYRTSNLPNDIKNIAFEHILKTSKWVTEQKDSITRYSSLKLLKIYKFSLMAESFNEDLWKKCKNELKKLDEFYKRNSDILFDKIGI